MTLCYLHRLCGRPCQFWKRWRMCILIIVASQSILLILFSDIIQRKSPRSANLNHGNTPITRTFWLGNTSIRAEWLPTAENGIYHMQEFNDSHGLKLDFPQRRNRLKYQVPEAKLKKINVAQLKQTLDLLSQKAEKSIIEEKQQSTSDKGRETEVPAKDVIGPMQSAIDKAVANKNENINGGKAVMERTKAGIDGIGKNYTAAKDVVDKVRPDQYSGYKEDKKQSSIAAGEGSNTSRLPIGQLQFQPDRTELGKTQNKSHVAKVFSSSGKELTGVLMRLSGHRKQQSMMEDEGQERGLRGPQVMGEGAKGMAAGSNERLINLATKRISVAATEARVNRVDLAYNAKVSQRKDSAILLGLGGFNRSEAASKSPPDSALESPSGARINPNKDKLTGLARLESGAKKLRNGLKHPINSPISINRAGRASIHHGPLHILSNISRFGQNSTDMQPNMTLSEALTFEMPPRLSVPNYFHLKNDERTERYFDHSSNRCFIDGTEYKGTNSSKHCTCKTGFYGQHCSIPGFVYFTAGSRHTQNITPRNTVRRIINALTYNMEFELLEARMNELWDVVDVFVILESNYSYHGDYKSLNLWESMRTGFLKKFHSKILYIFLDHFPEAGKKDGWLADRFPRQYIGQVGLRYVLGTRPDDLFIYTDADEIPSKEALLFLRLHDGYPEPFGFTLRWSVYGFFWHQFEPTRLWAGCTLAMLRLVYKWDVYCLRSGNYWNVHQASVATYVRTGGQVYDWHLGGVATLDDSQQYTGWHCSWCLPADRIKTKLTSAINADFPRWGDFPEKLNLDYIRGLIRTGTWFDDVTKIGEPSSPNDGFYAPTYILNHPEQFKALLYVDEAVKA